ncbi:MAG: hypothetical protein HFE83_06710 [Lachnospiraceae bacterium]|nr:hypothetical protein [Lachnospiraceae bacterium]
MQLVEAAKAAPDTLVVATASSIQLCASVDILLVNEFPDLDAKMPQSDAAKKELVKKVHIPVDGSVRDQ